MSREDDVREQQNRIVLAVAACRGGACSNPVYFAGMLVGCVSADPVSELIALDEIASALERIAVRQAVIR